MLNNNPNPLRAAYPELGNRTAMEALQNPAIPGGAAGLPVFTGPGGVAEAKTAEAARAALGLAKATSVTNAFVPNTEIFSGLWYVTRYGPLVCIKSHLKIAKPVTANVLVDMGTINASIRPDVYFSIMCERGAIGIYSDGNVVFLPSANLGGGWVYALITYLTGVY